MSNGKIILDLCGGTGAWSKPYRDAGGYEVKVITLPQYDVRRVEFNADAMHFDRMYEHNNDTLCVFYEDVYGILAAPPCTQFSLARTTAKTPRDLAGGREIMEACLRIIWACRERGNLKFWAMENPRGLMRQFMGRPAYKFEQWEFGDPGIKPTDIWGYFTPPKKTVSTRPDGLTTRYPGGAVNSRHWMQRQPGLTLADVRAITPAGFAQAFYRANK